MAAIILCEVSGCSGMNSHENIGQSVNGVENKQITEENNSSEIEETVSNKEYHDTEMEASDEDLDVVESDTAVNGLSMYIAASSGFQQENDWKIYTSDDGTMIIYYPGEPAYLEITDGDYAGLYEAGGDKMR